MHTTLKRRLQASGILLAAVVALVSAFVVTSSSSPANASVQQTAATLDSALTAPTTAKAATTGRRAQLRKDLKAARALTGDARKAALTKVRADARAGTYGDRIEKRLGRAADRRAAVLALLPDDLQADLTKLKAADKADRKGIRDGIRTKALAGGYGDRVKAAAEKLKDDWK